MSDAVPDAGARTYRTDDANALRLVDHHGPGIRRVADMGAWWYWDGTVWRRDHDDAHIREHARAQARTLPHATSAERAHKRNSLSSTGISSAVRVAATDPRVSITTARLDAHPMLLNTPTGTVDLTTATQTPHDPALLQTRITAVGMDLSAEHLRWNTFLHETFNHDEELIAYLQRLAGLALIGHPQEHVLPFLHGTGANGKSVLLNVLHGLLGPADQGGYALAAPDAFLMTGRDNAHPTEIARLRGARLLICSEQTSGRRFDEAKVKRLTGGDTLTGRFMRGDFFDFTPTHLTVIASNHLPQVREGGPSFWRRVRLIPFTHTVPEPARDPDLADHLIKQEGPAILAWAARGAAAVLNQGLQDPQRVLAATNDYRISEDTLASFIHEACDLAPTAWQDAAVFRHTYEHHCESEGVKPLSAKAVTMRLTSEHGIKVVRLSRPTRRIYQGITIRDDASPPPPAAGSA